MEPKKPHIDEYFKLAQADKPLLDLQEVELFISNTSQIRKTKSNLLKRIVMISITAIILTGTIYLMDSPKQEVAKSSTDVVHMMDETAKPMLEEKRGITPTYVNTNETAALALKEKEQAQLVNTQEVRLITLSNKELVKLGIKVDNTGIALYQANSAKTFQVNENETKELKDADMVIRKYASYIRYNSTSFVRKDNSILAPIIPAFVTDTRGENWLSYYINSPEYLETNNESPKDTIFVMMGTTDPLTPEQAREMDRKTTEKIKEIIQSQLTTLIPILVYSQEPFTERDKELGRTRYGIILWYEPSEKLFNALPASIANGLRNDYAALTGNTSVTSNCEYFEVCRSNAGVVKKLSSYPNPATDILHVGFTLDKSRKITIRLTDITGKLIKVITDNVAEKPGENNYDIDVASMKDGMYLLNVQSNEGEHLTQRIMIKH